MQRSYVGVMCLALVALVGAKVRADGATPVNSAARAASVSVDLFEAQKAGQIDISLIAHDSTAGTVVIKNKTSEPLTIKLPEAFAGVPVLAQRGRGAGGGRGGNLGATGGGNQQIGGGFGGGGGLAGGGIGGGGGGVFSIAPERAVKLKFAGVCLDHGQPEPTSRVPYKLVAIGNATRDGRVVEVVKLLACGEIDQRAAQAAVWHFAAGLSWQQLADKIGATHLSGATEPYFSSGELGVASGIAGKIAQRVAASERASSVSGASGGQ